LGDPVERFVQVSRLAAAMGIQPSGFFPDPENQEPPKVMNKHL
jgi:hypothetical protein